ncbi:MAG: hypothetical protein F8N38_05745 [Hungatella sp.]|nr:hypothetical protein [Hungatella sp.]MTK06574.1 hypothetical protein [Hungatella sp.]
MNKCLLILLVVLLVGCVQENGYNSVTPTIIAKGNLMGNGREQISKQIIVVSDSLGWNRLVTKMNSVNNVSAGFLEKKIDFTQYTVLAIFGDVEGSGGYSIDLNVFEDNMKVYVEAVYKMPLGSIVSMVITQPYLIVKIPRTQKLIQFSS